MLNVFIKNDGLKLFLIESPYLSANFLIYNFSLLLKCLLTSQSYSNSWVHWSLVMHFFLLPMFLMHVSSLFQDSNEPQWIPNSISDLCFASTIIHIHLFMFYFLIHILPTIMPWIRTSHVVRHCEITPSIGLHNYNDFLRVLPQKYP